MFEHFFQCPYCWERISMLLDSSLANTAYIEDCEVCCRPIQLNYGFDTDELLYFSAEDRDQ